MAILPISNVSVKNNPRLVSFGMRNDEDDDNNGEGYNFPRRVQNKMVTVPLATLIAMSPMVGNANEPAATLNSDKIIELAEANPAPEVDEATYAMGVDQSSAMTPAQRKYIQKQKPVKVLSAGNGAFLALETYSDDSNVVNFITYLPKDGDYRDQMYLPKVREIEYHDLGKNSFCGIWTGRQVRLPHELYYKKQEFKISNDAANALIDLLNGDTKMQDKTGLKVRVVKTPNLKPTENGEVRKLDW